MATIADPEVLDKASTGALEAPQYADTHYLMRADERDSKPIEILAAITRIFHLLPPTAHMYMGRLTAEVVKVENRTRRVRRTPFTKPLTQFFEKFPSQAVEHLFSQIHDPGYVRCFRLSLAEPFAVNLREEVVQTKSKYLLPLFDENVDQNKAIAGLSIVKSLVEVDAEWLVKNEDVLRTLIKLWESPTCRQRRLREPLVGDREQRETVLLLDLFVSFLKRKADLETYYAIVDVYTYKVAFDLTPTTRFVYDCFALSEDISFKRQVLLRFLDLFEDTKASQARKTQALRVLVNPMLFATLRPSESGPAETEGGSETGAVSQNSSKTDAKTQLLDAQVVSQILGRVWRRFQSGPIVPDVCYDDSLRIELLHMSTIILGRASHLLSAQGNNRKDTIKFGWANISSDDIMVKNAAYIFIAKFIEAFESPAKIIGQVYVGLLRSHQSEGRAMVRRALDILVPALPKRVGSADGGGHIQWAKWTRRVLVEEGHNSSQLFLILQLIVRHSSLFYPSRELFLPFIVNSLAKLGLAQSASAESRLLTVELVEVIVAWQKRREDAVEALNQEREQPAADDKTARKRSEDPEDGAGARKRTKLSRGGAAAQTSWPLLGEHAYSIPNSLREMIVGFLVRFISLSPEPIGRGGVIAKAFHLLKDVFKSPVWSEVQIKLTVFQRPLVATDIDEAHAPLVGNALQTLRYVVKDKEEAWITAHIAQLQRLLEKSIASGNVALLEYARPILEQLFKVLPDNPPSDEDAEGDDDGDMAVTAVAAPQEKAPRDDASSFRLYADTVIADGLKKSSNFYSVFVLLGAWSLRKPDIVSCNIV